MFSLVYKSTASPSFKYEDIQFMLEQARDLNLQNQITGCLLYYQGRFLQYIEGDEDKIIILFDKIKIDDRHTKVILLSHNYITERVFEYWDMAYEDFQTTNHQLEYLRLMVSLFIDRPNTSMPGNTTTKSFWNVVKKLLCSQPLDR